VCATMAGTVSMFLKLVWEYGLLCFFGHPGLLCWVFVVAVGVLRFHPSGFVSGN
jgi:hypothetical protein